MAIKTDYHTHSSYSGDSKEPMENMIKAAIDKGLDIICFTEHNDFDYPVTEVDPEGKFLLNVDSYLYDLLLLKNKYADRINVLFGIELGLQPSCKRENAILAKSHEFDFVIASSHIVNGIDPYYPAFYEGRSDADAYMEYFESELENINKFDNFDVYGHLDYVVRYGKNKYAEYDYNKFDEILKALIEKEKGIELNTAGLRKGINAIHPRIEVLKRYKELGGEIITVGSDAHKKEDVGAGLDVAEQILKDCGFKYYTIFDKRSPEYIKL